MNRLTDRSTAEIIKPGRAAFEAGPVTWGIAEIAALTAAELKWADELIDAALAGGQLAVHRSVNTAPIANTIDNAEPQANTDVRQNRPTLPGIPDTPARLSRPTAALSVVGQVARVDEPKFPAVVWPGKIATAAIERPKTGDDKFSDHVLLTAVNDDLRLMAVNAETGFMGRLDGKQPIFDRAITGAEGKNNTDKRGPAGLPQSSRSPADDFGDWSQVLPKLNARPDAQADSPAYREFWAEADAAQERRGRFLKVTRRIGATAIALILSGTFAAPTGGNQIAATAGERAGTGISLVTPEVVLSTASLTAAQPEAPSSDSLAATLTPPSMEREAISSSEPATLLPRDICGSDYVTSPFGPRQAPTAGASSFHQGVDLACESGAEIRAQSSGTVTEAGWQGGYGLTVKIDHGQGRATLYAHQSALDVSVGQEVSVGQPVGYVGSTGVSTGPHLHFERLEEDIPVDPLASL